MGGVGYPTADWQWINIGNRRNVMLFTRYLHDEEFIAEVIVPSEFVGTLVTAGTYRTAGAVCLAVTTTTLRRPRRLSGKADGSGSVI